VTAGRVRARGFVRAHPSPTFRTLPIVVAIDGPAGSGKSTLARALAKRLGWAYLDTGAMYRAVTLRALERGVDLQDAAGIAALAGDARLHLGADGRVQLDGQDVTSRIRSAAVDAAVSTVAANPDVRRVMVAHQRAFAHENARIVAEGRDIGTVVFPDAFLKIYLDATPEERARRRIAEIHAAGDADEPERMPDRIRESIERRDRLDRERPVAPLVAATDALTIHTTEKSPAQVLDSAFAAVQSRVPPPVGG
jgi:cytidylate kinase